MTMPDAALLILQADTALYGGIHSNTLYDRFRTRGILPWPNNVNPSPEQKQAITILNTYEFMNGKGNLLITFPVDVKRALINIYDIWGRIVMSIHTTIENKIMKLTPPDIPIGMYILKVETANYTATEKIVQIR